MNFETGEVSATVSCYDNIRLHYRYVGTDSFTSWDPNSFISSVTTNLITNRDYVEAYIQVFGDSGCGLSVDSPRISHTATTLSTQASLSNANLNNATLTLTLGDDEVERSGATSPRTWAASAAASHFSLSAEGITGLYIANVVGIVTGGRTATVTLGFTGTVSAAATVAVQVAAAAHSGTHDIASKAVAVAALPGFSVSDSSLLLDEIPGPFSAHRDAYEVRINTRPAASCTNGVVVGIASDNADVTASPSTLTFTNSNYLGPRRVTVTAASDSATSTDSATLSHTVTGACAPGYPTSLTIDGVSVTVRDDDRRLVVTPTELAMEEGSTDSYTVALSGSPAAGATVTVTATSTNPAVTVDSGATPTTRTLTFTDANWNTAQTVTVTALGDDDATDEFSTIVHAATKAIWQPRDVTVRVADDEESGTDYDADDDGLIEIASLAHLNAVRWDLDGDGMADSATNTASYGNAFPNAAANMGCADGPDADQSADCIGYELAANLDFDTDGDGDVDADDPGSYANWPPIGGAYSGIFQGNGRTISRLTVSTTGRAGLFDTVTGTVKRLGIVDASVRTTSAQHAGALAAYVASPGTIIACWSSGTVAGATANSTFHRGGLVGSLEGENARLVASFSTATVSTGSVGGGLVGGMLTYATVVASYATGAVNGSGSIGGLVGTVLDGPLGDVTLRASYATGRPTSTGRVGGIVGNITGSPRFINTYFDTQTAGRSNAAGRGHTGGNRTTSQLQTPTSTTGIYANWDELDIDGDGIAREDPWDFGSGTQYPVLRWGGLDTALQFNSQSANSAPSFGDGSVSNQTYFRNQVARFQIPAATGGNGELAYTAYGLPDGLSFDGDGTGACGQARTICGRPPTLASSTVRIAVTDQDDTDASDRDTLAFRVAVVNAVTRGVTLSASALSVMENGNADYTVWLALAPSGGNATIAITGARDGISAMPTSLTFTPSNWNTGQAVQVSAVDDLNGIHEVVTLTHTPSGGGYNGVATSSLVVTAADNDPLGLSVSPTQLRVDENDGGMYTIRLNTQPSGDVMVTVSGASGAVTVDTAAASGNQNTLTFTQTTWNTPQTVTVAAGDDSNLTNEMLTLGHSASGGGYDSLSANARPRVQLTVDDDDMAGMVLDANPATPQDESGPLELTEGHAVDASKSYTVRLSGEPSATTTVTVSSDSASVVVGDTDGDAQGVQDTLNFTATTWNTPQTVTLTAAEDDNGVPESAIIAHTSSGAAEFAGLTATIAANTTDDDTPGFVFDADPSSPGTNESGPLALDELETSGTNSGDYTVRLATQPTATATVAIASADATVVTVGDTDSDAQGVQNTLTFTTTNWNMPQTVTLVAQQDDGGANERVDISHTGGDGWAAEYGNVAADFAAEVDDDETPAIALSTATLSVSEESSTTYTVRLSVPPEDGSATVSISGAADGIVASPTSLTFTSSNYDAARTVTVTAADDPNGSHETVTLSHTSSGGEYDDAESVDLEVTAADDEAPGLQVRPTSLEVDENDSGMYTIRLNTQPSGDVTVTVSGTTDAVTVDTAPASGNQNALTFTQANWGATQTVTVSAGDDDNAGTEMLTLSHAAIGGSYGSLPLASLPNVQLTVADDDMVGIVLDADADAPNDQAGPLTLDELSTSSNNSQNYTVRLATEPTMQVEVAVSSGDAAVWVDTDLTPRTRTLTFTTTSWDTAQTVAAAAAEDDDAVNERVDISHTASGGDYAGVTADLAADTVDDDTPAIVATTTTAMLAEGFEATYTLRLATAPDGVATVSVAAVGGPASVDLDDGQAGLQSSLRFDAANWSTARTVTVRGLDDDDGGAGTLTLRHTASGADYGGAAAVEVAFAVMDDDVPALVVDAASVAVNEGATATYAASLATAPVGGPVTVSAMSSDAAAATVSPSTLTFSANDWNAPRTFTVAGVADGAAAIAHAASGADYGSASSTVAVVVHDTGAAGVRIEPPQLRLREGEGGVYAVRLNTEPGTDVTVRPIAGDADLTVPSDPLTFTTNDWSTARTVTVTVSEDDGADDEPLSVYHAVANYAGVATAPALSVLVRDNDAPDIVFDPPGGLRLSDSATTTGQYTAELTTAPTNDVTVRLSSDDAGLEFDADGNTQGDQSELTFTVANWNTPQAVRARIVADADAATETATLRHAASGGGYDGVSAMYSVVLEDADAAARPGEVTATPSAGALTVRWSAAANAEQYMMEWRRAGEDWGASRRLTTSATTARIAGLSAGARYLVRVTGLNRGWAGEASAEVSATVPRSRPPSPPPSPPSTPPPAAPPSTPPPAPPANQAPEPRGQLADVVLNVGETVEVQLSGAFADPDGDALAYSAASSNESAARATAAGTLLRVTGAAAGEAAIEARATDPGGLSAALRFAVRVVAPLSLAGDAEAPEGGAARLRVELGRPRSERTAFRWRVLADADAATANADEHDHGDVSGEGSIAAGATAAEIVVPILDDAAIEPAREWFSVEIEPVGDAPAGRTRARVAILEGVCDRTAAVRDALAGAAGCTAPTAKDLAAARSLELADRNIRALRADDLLGLSGLRTLDLHGNALAALPAGLLSATPRLRDLDLSGNALRSLPDGLFAGVGNLRSLRLDGNPGAPFALRVGLERTDAAPHAPGPATVRAIVSLGAPFAIAAALDAAGGILGGVDDAQATVPAGATAGATLTAMSSGGGAMRIETSAPTVPDATCGAAPCWRGIEAAAGVPLVLFSRPPTAGPTPEPAPLHGDELRLPLAALASAGDGGALRWTASSSDESVASVRIEGDELVTEPAFGAEGVARIEATATAADGQALTAAFDVRVEFYWPRSGWRSVVPKARSD